MARKSSQNTATTDDIPEIDFDFGDSFSSGDLEDQISKAAEELAEEGRQATSDAKPSKSAKKKAKKIDVSDSNAAVEKASANPPQPTTATAMPATIIPDPANDTTKSLRGMVSNFNRKPSSSVYWAAFIASIVWLIGVGAVAYTNFGVDFVQITNLQDVLGRPYLLIVTAALAIPIAMFWALALMIRRSQEMRLAAQSMTEVAYRLVEPEAIAEERLMSISQAVRREVDAMGTGIEKTLSRAVQLETMVHTEVTELERAYSDNETRIRALIDGLGSEREAVINHAERVRSTINGSREHLLQELNTMSDAIRENVATASTELSMTLNLSSENLVSMLNQSGDQITNTLDTRTASLSETMATSGQAFASLIDTRVSTLTQTADSLTNTLSSLLDDRTSGMVSLLTNATHSLSEQFDNRLEGLESTLTLHGEKIIREFETRSQAIEENTDRLNTALDTRARQINDTLAERTREIADTFQSGSANFAGLIDTGKQTISGELNGFVTSASDMVDETTNRFRDNISGAKDDLQASLTGNIEQIDASLNTHRQAIDMSAQSFEQTAKDSANRVTGALEEKTTDLVTSLAMGSATLEDALTSNTEALTSALQGGAMAIDASMQSRTDELNQTFERGSASIDATAMSHNAKIAETVQRNSDILAEQTNKSRELLSATLDEQNSKFADTLNNGSASIRSTLEAHSTEIDNDIVARTSELEATLSARAAEMSGMISSQIDRADERLTGSVSGLENAIYSSAERTAEAISARSNEITAQTAAMENALDKGTQGVQSALETVSQRIAENLRNSVKSAAGTLIDQAGEASRIITERQTDMSEHLGNVVGETERRLTGRLEQVSNVFKTGEERLSERASAIETQLGGLEEAFERADQRIVARTHQTSAELEARTRQVVETMDGLEGKISNRFSDAENGLSSKGNEFLAKLEDVNRRIDMTAEETRSVLERRTDELSASLAARSEEISRILSETGTPLAERLAGTSAQLSDAVRQAADQLAAQFSAEGNKLADTMTTSAASTLDKVQTSRDSLSGDVSDLIDRLSSSNLRLGQLVELAQRNLLAVDGKLVETTDGFAERTERIASQILAATDILGNNAERLDNVASGTLSQVASIANKFDDHGKVLARASDLLQAAQSNIEVKLEDRTKAIDVLSTGLLKRAGEIENVLGNFETLVSSTFQSAEDRTSSSSEALKASIREAIEDATARFTNATSEMQQAAQTIRNDLEQTRNVISRGVAEMPEETKATTETLKRAVSDQIGALKELSAIVARSSASSESRSPASRETRQEARQEVRQEPRPTPVMQPRAEQRIERPQPAPQQPQGVAALRGAFATNPEPQRRETPAPQKPRVAPVSSSDSYLANLLKGVSDEGDTAVQTRRATTPERTTGQVIESLNSMAVDIARAIDHEKAVELWNRYLRGEKDVFTRRLYTLRGQRTFDEISQKYRTDGEFRSVVDNYCNDFEKLLRNVGQGANAGREAERLLTAETGKVYTMLAHASGRLR